MTDPLLALQSQYLTFNLGDDLYAVPIGTVLEIRASTAPESLEDAPVYVAGGFRHGGTRLPLVDLRRRLGLPSAATSALAVNVVVQARSRRMGILADAVADVVDLGVAADALVSTHPEGTRAGLAYLKGAAILGEQTVLILDLYQLVSSADAAALDAALAGSPLGSDVA
jgi:purine-binding chemotaxis protein CheW